MSLTSRIDDLTRQAEELIATHPDGLDGADLENFEDITAEIERLHRTAQGRARVTAIARNHPEFVTPAVPPADPPATRTTALTPDAQLRGEALRSIDSWRADDEIKQAATVKLERTDETRDLARHVLLTGNTDYVSAFGKHLADPVTGYQTFTDAERRAWGDVKAYQRAALGLAGAVIPSLLDPALVVTNAGVIDPMRQVARIDTTTAAEKRYVTSAGVTASFDAELTEVSDDTPSLSEVTISVHKAQSLVQASVEVALDQQDFATVEVPRLFADAKARLEGDKLINGSGTNEPWGLWTRLDGTSSELSPATAEVFAAADVYSTAEGLPERWRPGAAWQAEISSVNAVDQMETGNGAKLFPRVGDADPVLLRRPLVENSSVAAHSAINPAATADNPILFYGDWSQYVILDRIGGTLEYIPHMFNTTTNLPDGRRGWYYFWRTGADVLTTNAFVVMNIATTA